MLGLCARLRCAASAPDAVVAVQASQQQRGVPCHDARQDQHAHSRAPAQVCKRKRQRRISWHTHTLYAAQLQSLCLSVNLHINSGTLQYCITLRLQWSAKKN